MAIIGVMLIVVRLVEKLEGKLVPNLSRVYYFSYLFSIFPLVWLIWRITLFNFEDKNSTW